jgi:hypothetical protein
MFQWIFISFFPDSPSTTFEECDRVCPSPAGLGFSKEKNRHSKNPGDDRLLKDAG